MATRHRDSDRSDRMVLMSVGGFVGGVLGFSIWSLTDMFVFLPVLLAMGLITGLSIVESWQRP